MATGHRLLLVVVFLPITHAQSYLPVAQWSPIEGPRISKHEGEYCFSYDPNSYFAPHLWYKIRGSHYAFYGYNQSPVRIDPRTVTGRCSPENRLHYDSYDTVKGTLENDGEVCDDFFTRCDIYGERRGRENRNRTRLGRRPRTEIGNNENEDGNDNGIDNGDGRRRGGRRIPTGYGGTVRVLDARYCVVGDEKCPHHGHGEHDCAKIS